MRTGYRFHHRHFIRSRICIGFILILLGLSACVVQRSPVTGKKRAYAYTWEQEVEMGKEANVQIRQQYGLYDDPELAKYVSMIGDSVLDHSDMRGPGVKAMYRNTKFYYQVLNSSVVNAFALPGGYVYVTRGILAALNNEAQLAMVLGHETGHVAARHASQSALQQQIGQIALVGGAIVGQEALGLPADQILQAGSQAAQLLFLRYSRDDEREADRLGVEYSAKAGYKSSDAAGFFAALEHMQKQSGEAIPGMLSTHPDPGDRQATIKKLAAQWKSKGYKMTTEDQQKYYQKIAGIIYGDNPREGFTKNGMFYHPDLKFQFPVPDGWQVINTASQVAMTNKDQSAVIIMSIDSENKSPQASVESFLSQQGVTTISTNAANQHGLSGYEALASASTQQGEVRIYLYGVSYNGAIYRFLAYTTPDKFAGLSDAFVKTAHGFMPLTDSSILNVKPVRIRITKADRSAKFSDLLPKQLPMNIKPEDVAILNQVNLDDVIPKGTMIKIPVQE